MSFALVTGASSGIGEALAMRFADDEHDLVLVARRQDRLDALAERLRAKGRTVHVLARDLGVTGAGGALFEAVSELGVEVDFLVNNAGFGSNGPFAELDPEGETQMVAVNITALVDLTRRFLPGMIARGRGRVLNIGSTAGFQAGPFMATYYASKAFVISFSEALAVELEGTGVTVTCACPGAVATEFGARSGNESSRLFQKGQVADVDSVADHAYQSMLAGRTVAVHGLLNALGAIGAQIGPRATAARIAGRLNRAP